MFTINGIIKYACFDKALKIKQMASEFSFRVIRK